MSRSVSLWARRGGKRVEAIFNTTNACALMRMIALASYLSRIYEVLSEKSWAEKGNETSSGPIFLKPAET